ncbi:MAG: hypothetical protein PVJ61_04880 [Dehalococcoidia bacterium]|jgi:hypothetical protein
MRTIVSLLVALTMVLGFAAGCQVTPPDTDYRSVSAGAMTVSIPQHWQRPPDYDELLAAFTKSFTEEELQYIELEGYGDEADEVMAVMMTVGMEEYYTELGLDWPGWEVALEEINMSGREYIEMLQFDLLGDSTDVAQETMRPMASLGYEAWEAIYTAEMDGEPVKICILIVLADNDVGTMVIILAEDGWDDFEAVWEVMRDSITI